MSLTYEQSSERNASEFWRKYSIMEKSIKYMRDSLKKGSFVDCLLSFQDELEKLGSGRT